MLTRGSIVRRFPGIASRIAPVLLLGGLPMSLAAAEFSVTPFAGYRWGGALTDIPRHVSVDLRGSSSFGLAIDYEIATGRRLELRFSRQPTDFKATGLNIDERFLDVHVDKLHIGGMQTWDKDEVRPFLVVSAGTTSFRPRSSDVSGDTRLSLGFGGGTQLVLGSIASIRLEGRLFSILSSRGSPVLCIGDECQIGYGSRNLLFQGEVAAGLTLSF